MRLCEAWWRERIVNMGNISLKNPCIDHGGIRILDQFFSYGCFQSSSGGTLKMYKCSGRLDRGLSFLIIRGNLRTRVSNITSHDNDQICGSADVLLLLL